MAVERDPYQVLGLPRSASLEDVKRAYRGLAKANHPDAAGESALPRFLAIQAAYEQIAGAGAGRPGEARPASRPSAADPDRAGGTAGTRGPRRGRNKATFGSTSYDGVDATPFEPDWGGASWYGTTSGTYWTLNPKEYADPRKHGPEYQARARRTSRGRSAGDA